jgi:hypothetical protein
LVWNSACYHSVGIEFHGPFGDAVRSNRSASYPLWSRTLRNGKSERASLGDVIAGPSIIAFGFPSREEAVANSNACFSAAAA